MNQTIVIDYRTRKDYCHCCDQKLPNSKISEIRKFAFGKEDIIDFANWKEIAEFDEDFQEIARGYVYETIDFFAVSHGERILIEDSELDKMKTFILKEIIN